MGAIAVDVFELKRLGDGFKIKRKEAHGVVGLGSMRQWNRKEEKKGAICNVGEISSSLYKKVLLLYSRRFNNH